MPIILAFATLFSKPVWESVVVLLIGAILAPGKRTISALLRVMGLQDEPHFQNYHRVLIISDILLQLAGNLYLKLNLIYLLISLPLTSNITPIQS